MFPKLPHYFPFCGGSAYKNEFAQKSRLDGQKQGREEERRGLLTMSKMMRPVLHSSQHWNVNNCKTYLLFRYFEKRKLTMHHSPLHVISLLDVSFCDLPL